MPGDPEELYETARLRELFRQYGIDTSGMTYDELVELEYHMGDEMWIAVVLISNGYDLDDCDIYSAYDELMYRLEMNSMRAALEADGIDTTGMSDIELGAAYGLYQERQITRSMRDALEADGVDTTGMTDEEIRLAYDKHFITDPDMKRMIDDLNAIGVSTEGLSDGEIIALTMDYRKKIEANRLRQYASSVGVDLSALSDSAVQEMLYTFENVMNIAEARRGLRLAGVDSSMETDENAMDHWERLWIDPDTLISRFSFAVTGDTVCVTVDGPDGTVTVGLDRAYLAGKSGDSTFTVTVKDKTDGYVLADFGSFAKTGDKYLKDIINGTIAASQASPVRFVFPFNEEQLALLAQSSGREVSHGEFGFADPVMYDVKGRAVKLTDALNRELGIPTLCELYLSASAELLYVTDLVLQADGVCFGVGDIFDSAAWLSR